MSATAEEIERRLNAGEWLRPGDVAILLDVSRSTVTRMLDPKSPVIRFRTIPGSGRHRELHPDDVRRQLIERRKVHGGDSDHATDQ